ncbi:hypothetical protein BD413DRAFT_608618 [Trametes elegans]|nr:hypothetical protein BD413DRAFT_608618 [Trametes elegans]
MFASPTRAGGICGWSPSNDSHDQNYTTIATTPSSSHPLHAHASLPSACTPRAATRSAIPRSLSLDSAKTAVSNASDTTLVASTYTPYHNPTSARRYKIKRQQDPSWAPRPPNAFILFRNDYVLQHQGERPVANSKGNPKEKTLSKRAGEAWKALSPESKKPWYERAKIKARDHAAANPQYVFRPKKRRSEPRKHPAMLSRREQVEEFVRKSSRRRTVAARERPGRAAPTPPIFPRPKTFDCPTPGSAGSSSSPEPPGTPSSEESNPLLSNVPTGLQYRSESHPGRLEYHTPSDMPPPPSRMYMSQSAMVSMPALIGDRPLAPKRSFSQSDIPAYSPWDYVNLGDDFSETDDQSIFSFESAISEPAPEMYLGGSPSHPSPVGCESTLQNPERQFIPQSQLAPDPLAMPEPQMAPAVDPSTTILPSTSFGYPHPPPSPLFERRRRAATISTLPSPLTVVTSSLSGWARDDLVTARMVPRPEPPVPPPPPMSNMQLMTEDFNWTQNIPPNVHDAYAATILPETDLDCTPRVTAFPQNAQGTGVSPHLVDSTIEFPMPEPQNDFLPVSVMDPYDINADLECYSLGLRQYGIGAGMQDHTWNTPPSYDIDYSGLYPCDVAREQLES